MKPLSVAENIFLGTEVTKHGVIDGHTAIKTSV